MKSKQSTLYKLEGIMKQLMSIIMLIMLGTALSFGQQAIPDINIKNLEGENVSSAEILNKEGHTILFFWQFGDEESMQMINDISDAWDTKDANGVDVEIVGICINPNSRNEMVKPYIYGNDIQFANYIDENGALKRAMNIPSAPFIMLIDEGAEMVYMHSGYCPGIPEHVCDQIVNYKNNSAINSGKYTMVGN